MGIISWLVSAVYKSLFLKGDTGYRQAHVAVKALLIISIALFISRKPDQVFVLAAILVPFGLLYPGLEWVVAVVGLSAFTGTVLAVSAYLLSLTGLYHMHALQILESVARTIGISVGVVFAFTIISPIELYNVIYALGGRKAAVFPLLLWKLIPQGLRNFADSLVVGSLKREHTTKRIPPAVASLIEAGWLIEEYCYWKLRTPVKITIGLKRSPKYTILLLVATVLVLLVTGF